MTTGIEGIAVARTEWMNGCERICIQPAIPKDSKEPKAPDCVTFDAPQIEVIEAGACKPIHSLSAVLPDERPGGPPGNNPQVHAAIPR